MAQTINNKTPASAQYTVLRAICMDGQRVEVGESVTLTQTQYAEAHAAGKVGPYVAPKPARAKAVKPEADKPAQPTEPTEPATPTEPSTEATHESI